LQSGEIKLKMYRPLTASEERSQCIALIRVKAICLVDNLPEAFRLLKDKTLSTNVFIPRMPAISLQNGQGRII